MYKTVMYFEDLQDNNYPYHPGDTFPRKGMEVSAERLAELSTVKNRRGIVLIEKVEEKPRQEEKKAEAKPKPRRKKAE